MNAGEPLDCGPKGVTCVQVRSRHTQLPAVLVACVVGYRLDTLYVVDDPRRQIEDCLPNLSETEHPILTPHQDSRTPSARSSP